MRRLFQCAVLAGFVVWSSAPTQAAEILKTQVVAATAMQAPGMPAGVTLESGTSDAYFGPVVANDGTVAFGMNLWGNGVTLGADDLAFYVRKPDGTYQMLARRGAQAPGLPDGARWFKFWGSTFSDSGQLAVRGILDAQSGTGGVTKLNDYAGWLWDPIAGFQLLAREGSVLSGDGTVTLLGEEASYSQPAQLLPRLTPDGKVAFWHKVQWGTSTGDANIVGTATSLGYAGRTGDVALGCPVGVVLSGYGTEPVVNAQGRVANRVLLANASGYFSVHTGNNSAICGPGPLGDYQVLAREGDAVPGVAGAVFLEFGNSVEKFSVSDNGSVLFVGEYYEGPSYRYGLFKTNPAGGVSPVLLGGQVAPGFPPNATIGTISATGILPNGDVIASVAVLYDADQWGGYSSKESVVFAPGVGGTLEPIMREFQPAPGCPNTVFSKPNNLFAANKNGEVVIVAQIFGEGATNDNNMGIWLYTPGKGLRLVLREGTQITVAPGDVRTAMMQSVIAQFATVSLRSSGRSSGLTDTGVMGIGVSFKEPNPTPGTNANSNGGMLLAWFEEGPDNLPPVAKDDAYTAAEETTLTIAVPGLLANDSDPENDSLTTSLLGFPSGGSLGVSSDGSFGYTPGPGFVGMDSFTYEVCDDKGACDVGEVSIEVLAKDACTTFDCDTVIGCKPIELACADDDLCTMDSCHPTQGCVFDDMVCQDGNACTQDSCFEGQCLYVAVVCADDNVCNGTETCIPATGCAAGLALNCSDFSECTVDLCDPQIGCQHQEIPCDDQNACTSDYCTMDVGCHHDLIDCADMNPCTANLCNPAIGCTTLLIEGCCETQYDCNPGGTCVDATCQYPPEDVVEQEDLVDSELDAVEDLQTDSDTIPDPDLGPDPDVDDVAQPPDDAQDLDTDNDQATLPDQQIQPEVIPEDTVVATDLGPLQDIPIPPQDMVQQDKSNPSDGTGVDAEQDSSEGDLSALPEAEPIGNSDKGGCAANSATGSSPTVLWLLIVAAMGLGVLARRRPACETAKEQP